MSGSRTIRAAGSQASVLKRQPCSSITSSRSWSTSSVLTTTDPSATEGETTIRTVACRDEPAPTSKTPIRAMSVPPAVP
ncbi:hypothetical protein [Nocardia beijingensis]|uniref:hypothetical protein n=1 Tax=Nocardia beijingensis TaxID=95162 RepID=UPI001893CC44|nr:hypothetical protein [Nocardia beijingensis]